MSTVWLTGHWSWGLQKWKNCCLLFHVLEPSSYRTNEGRFPHKLMAWTFVDSSDLSPHCGVKEWPSPVPFLPLRMAASYTLTLLVTPAANLKAQSSEELAWLWVSHPKASTFHKPKSPAWPGVRGVKGIFHVLIKFIGHVTQKGNASVGSCLAKFKSLWLWFPDRDLQAIKSVDSIFKIQELWRNTCLACRGPEHAATGKNASLPNTEHTWSMKEKAF